MWRFKNGLVLPFNAWSPITLCGRGIVVLHHSDVYGRKILHQFNESSWVAKMCILYNINVYNLVDCVGISFFWQMFATWLIACKIHYIFAPFTCSDFFTVSFAHAQNIRHYRNHRGWHHHKVEPQSYFSHTTNKTCNSIY